jgi:hypothetical protein
MANVIITVNSAAFRLKLNDFAPLLNGAQEAILFKSEIKKIEKFDTSILMTLKSEETFVLSHAPILGATNVFVVDKINNTPMIGVFATLDDLYNAIWIVTT